MAGAGQAAQRACTSENTCIRVYLALPGCRCGSRRRSFSLTIPGLVWEVWNLCATCVFLCKLVCDVSGTLLDVVRYTARTPVHSCPGDKESIRDDAEFWLVPLLSWGELEDKAEGKKGRVLSPLPLIMWLFFPSQM